MPSKPPGRLSLGAILAILALLLAPTARTQQANPSGSGVIGTGATSTPGGVATATGSVSGTGERWAAHADAAWSAAEHAGHWLRLEAHWAALVPPTPPAGIPATTQTTSSSQGMPPVTSRNSSSSSNSTTAAEQANSSSLPVAPMPAYANATLPSFSAVRACMPFTLLVQPNKNVTPGSNDTGTGG